MRFKQVIAEFVTHVIKEDESEYKRYSVVEFGTKIEKVYEVKEMLNK